MQNYHKQRYVINNMSHKIGLMGGLLHISAEPPSTPQEGDEDHLQEDWDLPQLPNLCSLTLG